MPVREAVAKWDALELEEAIIAAKGAGGMVRTMDEWARHPQAAAIASLPLMEIVRIGASPPEKLPDGDRPLAGVRVLDLTRVLAGPTCARTLAEHGADMLKITAPHLPNLGHQEFDTGHGKLAAHLDLREPKDVDTLRALVREAGPQFYPVSAIDYITGYLMAFSAMVALARRAARAAAGSCGSRSPRPGAGSSVAARFRSVSSATCRRSSRPQSSTAGRRRARRRSVGCGIWPRWCVCPRRPRAGAGPRSRWATTPRRGRPAPRRRRSMSPDDPRLPRASDFPPGTAFFISEFDVPLARVPGQGWFNWYGGAPAPYDGVPGYGLTEWPAESFEEWVGVVKASLDKTGR